MKEPLSIGIVGGMSPESTVTYYQHIVRRHREEFHDHRYPRIVIASVSFQQYIEWQHQGDWGSISRGLEEEFQAVALAGAKFAILATNTMHKILPNIRCSIPILTVFDAVASQARERGFKKVGLTGTKFTMSDGFYKERLEQCGLSVCLPSQAEQEAIHNIIYSELIEGRVSPESVDTFARILDNFLSQGTEAVLLGCTELEMLTRNKNISMPLLDSTQLHAEMAWRIAVHIEPLPSGTPNLH